MAQERDEGKELDEETEEEKAEAEQAREEGRDDETRAKATSTGLHF